MSTSVLALVVLTGQSKYVKIHKRKKTVLSGVSPGPLNIHDVDGVVCHATVQVYEG